MSLFLVDREQLATATETTSLHRQYSTNDFVDTRHLEGELWRLEQWLRHAEGLQKEFVTPPNQIEPLEDASHRLRAFLVELDSHRLLLNTVKRIQSTSTNLPEDIINRIEQASDRWESICANARSWHLALQTALMQVRNIILLLIYELRVVNTFY